MFAPFLPVAQVALQVGKGRSRLPPNQPELVHHQCAVRTPERLRPTKIWTHDMHPRAPPRCLQIPESDYVKNRQETIARPLPTHFSLVMYLVPYPL